MNELLSTKDLQELFQVSRQTIRNWSAKGTLKPVKISRNVTRFKRKDVEALIDE